MKLRAIAVAFATGALAACSTLPSAAPPEVRRVDARPAADSARAALDAAAAAAAAGDPRQAAAILERLRERDPDDPAIAAAYGAALRRAGEAEKAVLALRDADRRAPHQPAVLLELARAALARDYSEIADAASSEAAALPGAPPEARVVRAVVLARAGDRGGAQRLLEAVLREHPGHPAASADLALLKAEAGDVDAGIALLEPLTRQPGMPDRLHLNLAMLNAMKGDAAGFRRAAAGRMPASDAEAVLEWMRQEDVRRR